MINADNTNATEWITAKPSSMMLATHAKMKVKISKDTVNATTIAKTSKSNITISASLLLSIVPSDRPSAKSYK